MTAFRDRKMGIVQDRAGRVDDRQAREILRRGQRLLLGLRDENGNPVDYAALFELPKLLQRALLIKCLDYVSPIAFRNVRLRMRRLFRVWISIEYYQLLSIILTHFDINKHFARSFEFSTSLICFSPKPNLSTASPNKFNWRTSPIIFHSASRLVRREGVIF